ncbi:hypothetical protein [Actinomadura harenae]|uniref:Uncharacterized protein n=1 Tax=Actinomadura harenae TaxID=2483351 RepID=A0A3M2LP42_9ACTN|nr:hypothetical protein [Actinomadura harenae]RMI37865.1 hypothetical protein EBO15_34605 [Actinomadura harenae]
MLQALLSAIGVVNRMTFKATGGRVILYRFSGFTGIRVTILRRGESIFDDMVPVVTAGAGAIVLVESDDQQVAGLLDDALRHQATAELKPDLGGGVDARITRTDTSTRLQTWPRKIRRPLTLHQRHLARERRMHPLATVESNQLEQLLCTNDLVLAIHY